MYIYIHIYIHIYTYIYTNMYIYKHIYINKIGLNQILQIFRNIMSSKEKLPFYMHMNSCSQIHIHIFRYICLDTLENICIYRCICMYLHMYVYLDVLTCIYRCLCRYIFIHIQVIKDCVVTVPSSFTQHERKALYTAAEIADLKV
jgi:hypothetical protein